MVFQEWDESLVEEAENMPSDCGQLRHGPDYRVFPNGPDENTGSLINVLHGIILNDNTRLNALKVDQKVRDEIKRICKPNVEELAKALERGDADKGLFGVELFNPAQTRVGCAEATCTGSAASVMKLAGLPDLKLTNKRMVFNQICVLGPS